jgi:hypothetical protein
VLTGGLQIPFIALSVFCLGSSFQGIGVHKERLSPEQMEKTMMVCMGWRIVRRYSALTVVPVVFLLRNLLLHRYHPDQTRHFLDAHPCRW